MTLSSQKTATIDWDGGLGNQMFKLAALVEFARKTNRKIVLPDKSKRPGIYWDSVFANLFTEFGAELIPFHEFDSKTSSFDKFIEKDHTFRPIEFTNDQADVILYGYYQSCRHFSEYVVRQLFKPTKTIRGNIDQIWNAMGIGKMTAVSVHVRRGDYQYFPNIHPMLSKDYYELAMSLFPQHATFVVFSDDIAWCKETWAGARSNIFFVDESVKDYESLYLMADCKGGHIIANSSFSWWAAYIDWIDSKHTSKIVCPERWFGVDGPKENSLAVPGWLVLLNC